jgi:GTPase
MSQVVFGDTRSLAPSQVKKLGKLFQRKLYADELVSLEVARELLDIAILLRRRVGILVSREGHIEEVIVGDFHILYLPDLGRYRFGAGRLRRLRLIFTDLSRSDKAQIPPDIMTDLEQLRLDTVAGIKQVDGAVAVEYAYLVPTDLSSSTIPPTKREYVRDLGRLTKDFSKFFTELDAELSSSLERITTPSGLVRATLLSVSERKEHEIRESLEELMELARSAGVHVVETIIQRRRPDPRSILGQGKLEEVVLRCLRLNVEVLIFDREIEPSQWRTITRATSLKILDRSMVTLDIFAQRAKSSEGRLQVELAQLKYNLPRLTEMDSGLSRLSGGIGGRGPGETKLEISRRRSRDRITHLENQIAGLSKQREVKRRQRQEARVPLVSLVGYTNVGKSTLFNYMTGAHVEAEDKLFATLDTYQRKVVTPGDESNNYQPRLFVLSDTVGFIRDLPKELKSAFRATLEELYHAQLLLHVIDGSDPLIKDKMSSVLDILHEMDLSAIPQLIVINKSDLVDKNILALLTQEHEGVAVSATSGYGVESLQEKIFSLIYSGDAQAFHAAKAP